MPFVSSLRPLRCLLPAAVAALASCASLNTHYLAESEQNWRDQSVPGPVRYTLYAIGDAGKPAEDDPVLAALEANLDRTDPERGGVVFLGDNLYPRGLPPRQAEQRPQAETYLERQLEAVEDFDGRVAFLPGNHDWDRSGREGWDQIRRQAEYIDEELDREYDGFLPEDGCPGPRAVPLGKDALLVVFDSQWWLHPWRDARPGRGSDCDAIDEGELMAQIRGLLRLHADKKLFVAAHHPLISYGPHGGRFSARDHLFPLTALDKRLYLPLPGLGSLHPLYRGLIGTHQDIAHYRHQALKDSLLAIFAEHEHVVYLDGHEHSLQANQLDDDFFLVSGAGSKRSPVGHGRHARFTLARKGFLRLSITEADEVWVEYLIPSAERETGEVVFRKKLYTKPYQPERAEAPPEATPGAGRLVEVQATTRYQRGKLHRRLFGDNWRDVWDDTLQIPILDMANEHGGLRLVQQGGGMQTKSLRTEAPDGKQYNLRSVNKYATGVVPPGFEQTFAQTLVQDAISGAHPYGALAAVPLAERIGVYHTDPKLRVLPDDPRLGRFRDRFAGMLVFYEKRPDEEVWDDSPLYDFPPDIESTSGSIEELNEDNDELVDQQLLLKTRLFDMWIGDWDRHQDQWRWSEYERERYDWFRPIPRDRDQVFFHLEGPIPWLVSRRWLLPKFQGFHETIRNVGRYNANARHFDRYFLTEPDARQWRRTIDTLQAAYTEAFVDSALRAAWPGPVYRSSGPQIGRKLLARRDRLDDFAMEYYRILARAVDVKGSDKHERFIVEWEGDTALTVTVHKTEKDGYVEHRMYQRRFRADETDEVRLYGMAGVDRFLLRGAGDPGIRLRIVGGDGSDYLSDERPGDAPRRRVHYYDMEGDFLPEDEPHVRTHTSRRPSINAYDREAFEYDYLGPSAFFGYNPDDGLFLGGGVLWRTHGFRKEPFASRQRIVANYAFRTRAYNFRYEGAFTDALGKLDLAGEAVVNAPEFAVNYYGLGNGTPLQAGRINLLTNTRFYNTRFERYLAELRIGQITEGPHRLSLGPFVEDFRIEEFPDAFTEAESAQLSVGEAFPQATAEERTFWGGVLQYSFERMPRQLNPREGIRWENTLRYGRASNDASHAYLSGRSALSLYFTLPLPLRTTLALRGGGAFVDGEFPFYRAAFLGGQANLRGYGRNRFAGNTAVFQNTELRVKLGRARNYLLNGEWGFHAFRDLGRVEYWEAENEPDDWRVGYGAGLWIAPYNQFVLRAAYAQGEEVERLVVGTGFLF